VVFMGKIILVLFITFFCVGFIFQSTVYLNGNKEAINAKVYIDNKFVGTMTKIDSCAHVQLKIKAGNHNLRIVNCQGKLFTRDFYIKGENYISVDFKATK